MDHRWEKNWVVLVFMGGFDHHPHPQQTGLHGGHPARTSAGTRSMSCLRKITHAQSVSVDIKMSRRMVVSWYVWVVKGKLT